MTEEEKLNCGCEHKNENDTKKKHCMKYIGIVLATLLGSFLAFYFVADMTLKNMMNPANQFRRMDKMMERHSRDMEKMDRKMMKDMGMPPMFHHKSMVVVDKLDDEYKILVDLRAFDNNEKNVKFDLNNNIATVSASIEKENRHEDSIVEFSQSFYLSGDLDKTKIKKEKDRNKYVITIPLKDND